MVVFLIKLVLIIMDSGIVFIMVFINIVISELFVVICLVDCFFLFVFWCEIR